ncbi:MAG: GntR family transcriptional regulator [bacterium]|nr:GntR family transcriptional regulator [bacterium]
MENIIRIDKENPLPVYVQIKQQIKAQIKNKQLNPFDRIPSIPEMTRMCRVSPMTIRHAYTELVNEGLLFREHGKGTFVADLKKASRGTGHLMTKSVGLIVPDIMSDVFPKIVKGAEDVAHNRDYSVIICNTEDRAEKQVEYLQRIREQKISGLIITPIAHASESVEHYQQLQRDDIPFVFINRFIPEMKTDYVISDNVMGGYLAAIHLIELGHQKLAYISDPKYIVAEQRLEGYKKAMAERGISFDESLVRFAGSCEERPGYKYMKEFMKSNNRPTALFAFNDRIAEEAYEAIVEAGLRVPEDVAIVGYDDSLIAISLPVPLTTVAYPSYETGRY